MKYESPNIGFSFELSDDWRRLEHAIPLTFNSDHGIIQIDVGVIGPQFLDPTNRERFLDEPGAEFFKDAKLGEEANVVFLIHLQKKEGCISAVRDKVHYTISWTEAHKPEMQQAMERLRESFVFPQSEKSGHVVRQAAERDPAQHVIDKIIMEATSVDGAERIMIEKGMRPTEESRNSTRWGFENEQRRKWWQFWR